MWKTTLILGVSLLAFIGGIWLTQRTLAPSCPVPMPMMSGPVCDGGTDDTAAIQALISANGPVKIPAGVCVITDTLLATNFRSVINGKGRHQTVLRWEGPNDRPLLRMVDANWAQIRNLTIDVGSPDYLFTAIEFARGSGGIPSSNNLVRNVVITRGDGILGYGVETTGGSNGELMRFENVQVHGAGVAGFRLSSFNHKMHKFTDCSVTSSQWGVYVEQGSFHWRSGTGTDNVEDFRLVSAIDTVLIDGHDSERSTRLVGVHGTAPTGLPLRVENVRYADSHLASDGCAILYRRRGTLAVLNSQIGAVGNPTGVCFRPIGGQGTFYSEGNLFITTLMDPYSPAYCNTFLCLPPGRSGNNLIREGVEDVPFD